MSQHLSIQRHEPDKQDLANWATGKTITFLEQPKQAASE